MAHLTREARQVLAEMELLSYGKTASLNSSGLGGEKENPVPQGDADPLADQWRFILLRCAAHDLEDLVREARDELDGIRRRDPALLVESVEEPRTAWEARLVEEGEGYEARHVATSFLCGVKDVMRVRLAAGRDPSDGRLTFSEDKVARVKKLAAGGLSEREIQAQTGVAKTTVRRIIGRAA